MTIESGTSLAHYEVSSPLGKGGMGEVFRARDTKLGREVAIKILPEEFTKDAERLARFDREAKLLASLNHPHVAAIHGLEEVGGRKFLVMELAHGETLADRIRRGPIPVDEAIAIAKPIAQALEAAHDRGIIHRDLKPGNVMVDQDGVVKVLDFGLAKALDVDEDSTDVTNSPTMVRVASHTGVILGTAAYMSPEQAKGKRVDRRADIWAFGVVLFEMLTGDRIFGGETVSDSLARVIMSEPDFSKLPPGTPSHVRTLLERCLVKDPKQRLQAIGEARIALESGPSATVATASTTEALAGSKTRGAAGALPWVIAALLGAALAGVVVLRKPEPKLVWKSTILMKAASQAQYASGRLLYVREQALMAQPFDLKAGKTTGEAIPIAERVAVIGGAELGLFSASQNGVLAYHTGSLENEVKLELRDRTGNVESNLGDAASYQNLAMSADGRSAAVSIADSTSGASDLWIYDVERGIRSRFSFDAADDTAPLFSPDGKWLYFASNRSGVYDIYRKALGGTDQDELVLKSDKDKFPADISPDGRELAFDQRAAKGIDMFVIALEANAKPRPFRVTEFNEAGGRISPDGRWLAYNSLESGEWHTYITSFPEPGRLWQVSTEPAVYPEWRADGGEVYLELIAGGLSAVAIRAEGESLTIGKPEKLFEMQTPGGSGQHYVTYGDGQRFLVVLEARGMTDAHMNLVVNWPEELDRK